MQYLADLVSCGYSSPPPTTDENGHLLVTLPLPHGASVTLRTKLDATSDFLPRFAHAITRATPDAEPVTIVVARGVRRRILLRTRGGRNISSSLRVHGPATIVRDKLRGSLFLLDPNERYLIEFNILSYSKVLATESVPPAADDVTEFLANWPERNPQQSTVLEGGVHRQVGTPLAGVAVLSARIAPFESSGMTLTRRDGTFRIRVVRDQGLLAFRRPGYGTLYRQWDTTKSRSLKPVQMEAGCKVRLRVQAPADWRPADWALDVRAAGWPRARRYEFDAKSPDQFTINPAIAEMGSLLGDDMDTPWGAQVAVRSGAEGVLVDLPIGVAELRFWTDGTERTVRVKLVPGTKPTLALIDLR